MALFSRNILIYKGRVIGFSIIFLVAVDSTYSVGTYSALGSVKIWSEGNADIDTTLDECTTRFRNVVVIAHPDGPFGTTEGSIDKRVVWVRNVGFKFFEVP